MRRITDDQLDRLATLADTCDNLVGAINAPGTGPAHIEALRTGLEGISAEIKQIVTSISGDDPWKDFA